MPREFLRSLARLGGKTFGLLRNNGEPAAGVDVVAAEAIAAEAEEPIVVTAPGKETISQNVSAPEAEQAPAETSQERRTPGPGAALAVIALLLVARRRGS